MSTSRTFYTLLVTQAFSLLGSRMTAVAVGIWVFSLTGQATPLLLTSFFTELPGMLFGSLAGVLVDRWNRKRVMLLADIGQALASLLLLASILSGDFQLWHLYTLAFLQGSFAILQGPAESATMTLLVPESQRERANGILELTFPLAGILAPALAGVIYSFAGIGGVIAIDLATFLAAAGILLLLAIPQPPPSAEGQAGRGRWLSELRGGLGFLRRRPALFALVLYIACTYFLLNGPLDLVIPYSLAVTGSEQQAGLVLALMSLGAFSGGLLVAALGRLRPRLRLLWLSMLFAGLMFLAFGLARSLPGLAASLFLLMVPLPIGNALSRSVFQVKIPPDLQGRVFAFNEQLYMLGSTASFLLTGPLIDRFLTPLAATPAWAPLAPLLGPGPAGAIGLLQIATGLLMLLVTLLFFAWRPLRQLESELPDVEAE